MKAYAKILLQAIHSGLVNSVISRIYVALIVTPKKIRTISYMGTPSKFFVTSSFVQWYVSNFIGISKNELNTQNFLREELRDGDVFYDVGANIGCYVVWVANRFRLKECVAFEPEAINFAALSDNVRLNNGDNVICLPIAASDSAGYVKFWTEDGESGNASGYIEGYAVPQDETRLFQYVRAERIESLIEAGLLSKPDVVLIDVDGGELNVLTGFGSFLEGCRAVIVEIAAGTEVEVDEILRRHGFSLHLEKTQRRGNRIYIKTPPE